MMYPPAHTRVLLALSSTDMRKAINELSMLVEGALDLDPFPGHLFVFCNRRRTLLKVLYWDRNGFCLWQKRLEKHRFPWPERPEEVMEIRAGELGFLFEGVHISSVCPHESLHYSTLL